MYKLANISQFESLMNASSDGGLFDDKTKNAIYELIGTAGCLLVKGMVSHGYTYGQALSTYCGLLLSGAAGVGGYKLAKRIKEKLAERKLEKQNPGGFYGRIR